MAYRFNNFQAAAKTVEEWLVRELSTIRTGRATPALLDSVQVEAYGAKVPLKQIGALGTEDPRTLKLTLWDKGQLRAAEQAIQVANLGVSTASDGTTVRIIFPELTAEKRALLSKLAHDKVEQARVSLRQERERVWNDIQAKEKSGELGEDEKYRLKEELQQLVDEANRRLEDSGRRKEQEIAK